MSKRFNIAFENTTDITNSDPELQDELLGDGFNPDDDSAGDEIDTAISIEAIANELDADITENDRIIDVADSLGDIKTIVENTPDDQQIDTNLVQTAANMAVAGTDSDAQDVVPSMESFANKRLAIEGLGAKIKNALKSVVDSVKEIGTKIGSFVKETFKSLSFLTKRINEHKQKLNSLDRSATASVTFRGKQFLIGDSGEQIGTIAEFKKAFSKGHDVLSKISPVLIKAIGSFNKAHRTAFMNFMKGDAVKRDEQAKMLYNEVVVNVSKALKSLPNAKKTSEGNPYVQKQNNGENYSISLGLSTYSVGFSVPSTIPAAGDNITDLRDATTAVAFWHYGESLSGYKNRKREMTTDVKVSDLMDILSMAEDNIAVLKTYLEQTFKQTKLLNVVNMGSRSSEKDPETVVHVNQDGYGTATTFNKRDSFITMMLNKVLYLETSFVRSLYNTGYKVTAAGIKLVEQGIRALSANTSAD